MAGNNENFEVEEPPSATRSYFAEAPSRIFPFEPFKCLPVGVKAFIPGTWQKIQDGTHCILIVGVFATILLVLDTLISLISMKCFFVDFLCFKEFLSCAFILPCSFYCLKIISQYDERLTTKQRDAKEQKENLTRSYNDLLSDMDNLLSKSTETNAQLAERSFESKRRDFQRFLERAKNKFSPMYSGTKSDSDKLLKQFRRFCVNWLHVFEECSIDPIQAPKRVVLEEELNRCTSIVEVVDLCLERLRVTEVRFISIQKDQDAQMIRRQRTELKRLTVAPHQPNARELAAVQRVSSQPGRTRMSWISVGSGHGFGVQNQSEEGFPKELRCGCGRLVILSREHFMLLSGSMGGLLLILLHIIFPRPDNGGGAFNSIAAISNLILTEVCLFTMLRKFEEIDVIQQLEKEVKELAKQNQHVEQQREKMREFWTNAQQLTDLWTYRTVPRLDLYKEIHSLLEDSEEDLLMKISSANQHLEDLDCQLAHLEAWRSDGALKSEDKKIFAKCINELCQEQEFDSILVKLEEISTNAKSALSGNTCTSFAITDMKKGASSTALK